MIKYLVNAYNLLGLFGFNPRKLINTCKGIPFYIRDLNALNKQKKLVNNNFPILKLYPCLEERFTESGNVAGHYFHQDLLVARRIYTNKPAHHVDVGSRVDGLIAHVASFRLIEVLDIRPNVNHIHNITFSQCNIMDKLEQNLIEYTDSLSCLHALEHFGLGRYGDPINYSGYLTGLNNLQSILKKNGKLYFSVPIGPQRIEFNAHRVFSLEYLLELISNKFHIDYFSFVDDNGDLHENVELTDEKIKNNYKCLYGCGVFELTKL